MRLRRRRKPGLDIDLGLPILVCPRQSESLILLDHHFCRFDHGCHGIALLRLQLFCAARVMMLSDAVRELRLEVGQVAAALIKSTAVMILRV